MPDRFLRAPQAARWLGAAPMLLLAAQLAAQVPAATARRITFSDAVRIALQQNISLAQAQNDRALTAVTVRQQQNQFLPNLNLSTNTSGNIGQSFNQTAGRLVNQTSQTLNAGVSSNVTLFNGFQNLSLLRQARFSESASESDLARTRQTVVFTVASNFLAIVTLEAQLQVQSQNLGAQQEQLAQIEQLVKAGSRSIADLYQQQAAVANAQSAVVTARRALELAKVDLIQTLQLDPGSGYDFVAPAIDTVSAPPRFTLVNLLERAFADRADLAAARQRVDAAADAQRAASSTRWPQIAMNLGYNSGYTSLTSEPFSTQLNQRKGGSVGLTVAIPLFDRGTFSVAAQQAAIQSSNARLTSDRQRQTVALEVRRAFLDYEAALDQINATRAQQRAADLALKAVQERYRVGAATLVELSVARAAQVTAASAAVNARYTLVFQQSLMAFYTGALDPATVTFGQP